MASKPKRSEAETSDSPPVMRPHPDDEADVRAGLEEAERGDVLSAEESEAYVRSLLDDERA